MIEGVLGRKVGCAKVVISVGNEHLQIGIEGHRLAQSFAYINVLVLELGI